MFLKVQNACIYIRVAVEVETSMETSMEVEVEVEVEAELCYGNFHGSRMEVKTEIEIYTLLPWICGRRITNYLYSNVVLKLSYLFQFHLQR